MNLRAERLNRGLSIVAAAKEMGVPEHVLRYAESGGNTSPANALKIASFFGVKVTDVWPVDDPKAAA